LVLNAPVASRIGRAIAHQNPTLLHGRNECRVFRPDPCKYEIRLTGTIRNIAIVELQLEAFTSTLDFTHVLANVLLIGQSLGQRD
jgi:hypothetical protein